MHTSVRGDKKVIFGWAVYDWANSAYITTIAVAILPMYFAGVIVPAEGFRIGSTVFAAEKRSAGKKFDYYGSLKNRLATDGFDKKKLTRLYQRKGVGFDVNGVSLYFVHREASLNYGQFTDEKTIKKAPLNYHEKGFFNGH